MTGSNAGHASYTILNKYANPNNIKYIKDLAKNFVSAIQTNNISIVALQEAACVIDRSVIDPRFAEPKCNNTFLYQEIQKSLPNYKQRASISGAATVVTMWDSNKIPEDPVVLHISIDKGRPCLVLKFPTTKLIIINCHNSHLDKGNKNLTELFKAINKPYRNHMGFANLMADVDNTYTVILAGDLNADTVRGKPLKLYGPINLQEPANTFNTCCYNTDRTNITQTLRIGQYDHILSNKTIKDYKTLDAGLDASKTTIQNMLGSQSDHAPIMGTIVA